MSWGLHVSGPSVPTVQGAGSPSSMVLSVPGVRVRTSRARSREKSIASTSREDVTSPEVTSSREVDAMDLDRKSTRLNSSHSQISYAVFCLKKKKRYKARA